MLILNKLNISKLKKTRIAFGIILLSIFMFEFSQAQDWANLNKYKDENASLALPLSDESRVVFMGNSITESWGEISPAFFLGKHYINRGISGQTTGQMLLRFRSDVINLKPTVVVILAGTNDIAGNTGPTTIKLIAENIFSMAELAKANSIKVILSSVLPAYDYPWKPGLNPAKKIVELNKLLKNYADKNEIIYLDYFSSLVDARLGLKSKYTRDGVHPNKAGYKVMAPLAKKAIEKALWNK